MDETKKNPVIRVYPQTRKKIKQLAASDEKTMQDFLEWLVDQEIELRRRDGKNANEKL